MQKELHRISGFTEAAAATSTRRPPSSPTRDAPEMSALGRRTVELTVIAQDPSVRGADGRILTAKVAVPADRLRPGPRSHRFHVVDYDATSQTAHPPAQLSDFAAGQAGSGWTWTDHFANGISDDAFEADPAFRAQNLWAVASRTLAAFEQFLGRRLPWAFDSHELFLVPTAFIEPNAYYAADDHAVLFGYVPGRRTVYTCLSHDIVAHEVTHAILDGLRPRLAEPGLPDQPAFHEAFADIVALLSVFSMPEVVQHQLGAADASGRIAEEQVSAEALRRGVLVGLAEELGSTLSGERGGALRRSVKLTPTKRWRQDPTFDEPHRRAEVLVAAVVHTLLRIWAERLKALRHGGGLNRERTVEEGAKAAAHLLGMCIRGVDYTPPVEFEFEDFIDSVLLADEVVAPDDAHDYRDALREEFGRFGINAPKRRLVDLAKQPAELVYQHLNFDALRTDCDEIYRFIWQNAELLGIDLRFHLHVERVRHATRVGPDGLVVNEILADYVQVTDAPAATLADLGMELPPGLSDDRRVQIWGGGVLVFDQFGRARYHQTKPLQAWRRQNRRLAFLVGHGQADTKDRYGFSLGQRRGQRFSELHVPNSRAGEAW
jgi:hypothetical protein